MTTYDSWKSTNPADQWLGPDPEEEKAMDNQQQEPHAETATEWRIFRNGVLYARRETFDAAEALIDFVERYTGETSKWEIISDK
jgi:hypothetical protein